ncbi:GerAB/ArcD/ProY family transporter [Paenibacillus lentus]|uniref:GerAB/ArcD/ProY family transporter n=1 Tax=Paenibacillus lentus TaxID=1338368 RepID=UPI00364D4C5B
MSSANTSAKDQITTSQAAVLLINYTLGAGILTLPRTTVDAVQTPDVWISTIIAFMIITVAGLIVVLLCRRFQGKTLFQFVPDITGKWLAWILSLTVIAFFLLIAAIQIRIMAEVTVFYLLEGTPTWAIVMSFMWIGLYLTLGGINCMARMYEVILPITLVFFLISILLSSKIFDINHFKPVLGSGIMPVIKGIKPALLPFIGYEIMLVTMAYMKTPQKAAKALLAGTIVPLIVYLATILMVIGGLSTYGVRTRVWPTLDLLRSFEIQGLIFERFESLLLVIWIMQIFSTFTITHYAASLGWSQLFNKNIKIFLFAMLPVIFLIAMLPKNVTEIFKLGDIVGTASIYIFGGVPLLLLLISIIRKKGGSPN